MDRPATIAPALVVFSGMDGGGKSTQIDGLVRRLNEAGRPTVVCWVRGGYTPLMNAAKSWVRKRAGKSIVPAAGHSEARSRALSRPTVRKMWLALAICDLILLYGFWLRWCLLRRRTVVCDRYVDDTLLDFQFNFPAENVSRWWLWKLLQWIAVTPDAAFLILIPVSESQRRSLEKKEPFPDSTERLAERLAAYQTWEGQGRYTVLDGMESRESVADRIWQHLLNVSR